MTDDLPKRDELVVRLFAGPAHGRNVALRDPRVAFLRGEGGYYGRVQGGRRNEFYWHQGSVPIAFKRHKHANYEPVIELGDIQ